MEESLNPTVNIGPISFDLTLLAMSLVTVLMVFAFVYWASRKMAIRPKGKQNALEMIYDFVIGFTNQTLEIHISRIIPCSCSLYFCLSWLPTILA